MITFDDKLRFSKLLDLYSSLLNEKQIKILEDYYNYDLSLTEIAENNNVSKNAVHDLIKRVSNTLNEYDKSLNLLEKQAKLENLIEEFDYLDKEDLKIRLKELI